ncbi:MAG TPA: secretin N-terminal domain-containing protein, partial [Gemmataceae bacterium]|nr:secretin N-terminal domain-containing protein [Gemmataceae bacterium]
MRSQHLFFQRMGVALAGVAVLLLGFAFAYAQNAPGKGKIDGKEPVAKPEPKKGDAFKSHIKVFRLTHVDLETITPVLNNLLPESMNDAPAGLPAGGGALGIAGGAGLGGGPVPGGGALGLGGGALGLGGGALGINGGALGIGGGALGLGGLGGMLGGGLGLGGGGLTGIGGGGLIGAAGGVPGAGPMSWRIAEDPRTKSLVVRGPEKVIEIAADLVAVLDLPADKPIPAVKNLRAYKLKHAKAD